MVAYVFTRGVYHVGQRSCIADSGVHAARNGTPGQRYHGLHAVQQVTPICAQGPCYYGLRAVRLDKMAASSHLLIFRVTTLVHMRG